MIKPSRPRLTSWLAPAAAVGVLLSFMAGCGKPEPSTVEVDPTVRSYTVKGRIAALPDAEIGLDDLTITHEAIPEFRDRDGEVVSMDAHAMPFPLGEGVSIEGFLPGDAVEFTFEVDYTLDGHPQYITQIKHIEDGKDVPPIMTKDYETEVTGDTEDDENTEAGSQPDHAGGNGHADHMNRTAPAGTPDP